jgi:hypothetical protein
MRIHAICIALNEEDFIAELLKSMYPFCSGISIITQYDRDYFGKRVIPDNTVKYALDYPDPEGKIHVITRRYNDETASRNHEMMSVLANASEGIKPHGVSLKEVKQFFEPPEYFLIVDADEIYDVATFPAIVEYLQQKKPTAMRVSAYEYGFNWNLRVPPETWVHHQFGFVKAGVMFEERRVITWNEYRLKKFLSLLKMDQKLSNKVLRYTDCPKEVGIFHHGAYVRRDKQKMMEKMSKHSHPENHDPLYLEKVLQQKYDFIPTAALPINIREGSWPEEFFARATQEIKG